MHKFLKEKINNFFYFFNKKIFRGYYAILKAKPQKVTRQFLSRLIIQNSKAEKKNSRFFLKFGSNNLNDLEDDEKFFF